MEFPSQFFHPLACNNNFEEAKINNHESGQMLLDKSLYLLQGRLIEKVNRFD